MALLGSGVRGVAVFACTGGDKQQQQQQQAKSISFAARAREEVISPFRAFRMFLYPAFMAGGTIAGLTSLPRLVASMSGSGTAPLVETAQGLGIDVAAVLACALLYRSDLRSRDLSLAKLSREESLGELKIELANKRIFSLGQMRGTSRFVIVAGPQSHVEEALERSEAYQKDLMERGITVIPFVTSSDISSSASAVQDVPGASKWIATPLYTAEWSRWINEQKELAKIPQDSPVYLSLRLDGRVRGSGVGYPPWAAFVAQLPPLKGMWRGALDGMDGKV